jgi:hypothetical protein
MSSAIQSTINIQDLQVKELGFGQVEQDENNLRLNYLTGKMQYSLVQNNINEYLKDLIVNKFPPQFKGVYLNIFTLQTNEPMQKKYVIPSYTLGHVGSLDTIKNIPKKLLEIQNMCCALYINDSPVELYSNNDELLMFIKSFLPID